MTQILTLKDIPEDQLKRLLLIETLYEEGLNSAQISDFLNRSSDLNPYRSFLQPKNCLGYSQQISKKKKTDQQYPSVC